MMKWWILIKRVVQIVEHFRGWQEWPVAVYEMYTYLIYNDNQNIEPSRICSGTVESLTNLSYKTATATVRVLNREPGDLQQTKQWRSTGLNKDKYMRPRRVFLVRISGVLLPRHSPTPSPNPPHTSPPSSPSPSPSPSHRHPITLTIHSFYHE